MLVYGSLLRQLVLHVESNQLVLQHRLGRRLRFIQFQGHRCLRVVPFPLSLVVAPVRLHEVQVQPLLNLRCTSLQVLCVVNLLLPEVDF